MGKNRSRKQIVHKQSLRVLGAGDGLGRRRILMVTNIKRDERSCGLEADSRGKSVQVARGMPDALY